MALLRRHRADLIAVAGLILLPLIWLLPVVLAPWTGLSIIPYDTLVLRPPFDTLAQGLVPSNAALENVVLQNHAWRHLLRAYIAQDQIPLWNPHTLTGTPFLAGGQAGSLYPPALLLLFGSPDVMLALYAALHLSLAAIGMFLFGRTLHLNTWAATLAGLAYGLGGYSVTHAILPTVIATAAWLPWLLAMMEIILRKQETKGPVSFRPIPYMLLGAMAITMGALAWNPELFAYACLFCTAYLMMRLVALFLSLWRAERADLDMDSPGDRLAWLRSQSLRRILKQLTWLGVMVVLGLTMAAVQLIPFAENYWYSHRDTGHTFQRISDLAWPGRQLLTFWIPNAFGNPSHHRWFDPWLWTWVDAPLAAFGRPAQTVDWGLRSYVDGASYVGLIVWPLALVAVIAGFVPGLLHPAQRRTVWFALAGGLLALQFALGLPAYRILYAIPGWSAILSAHNWIFIFVFCLSLLGGLGLQAFTQKSARLLPSSALWLRRVLATLGMATLSLGGLALAGLALMYFSPGLWTEMVRTIYELHPYAHNVFRRETEFLAYAMGNGVHLAAVLLAIGALFLWRWRSLRARAERALQPLFGMVLVLLLLDLFAAHGDFLPQSDRDFSPARNPPDLVRFLADREPASHAWRMATFTESSDRIWDANLGFYYGWHDLRGKTYLTPAAFVEVFDALGQVHWRARRGDALVDRRGYLYASFPHPSFLRSQLLDLWNVKYLLSTHTITDPAWRLVHQEDAVLVYENQEVFPRAFVVPHARQAADMRRVLRTTDLAATVLLEGQEKLEFGTLDPPGFTAGADIAHYTANEVRIAVHASHPAWLVLSDTHFPGWKARLLPRDDADDPQETPILRAYGSLRAVQIPAGFAGEVQFVYEPLSFRVGLFFSFLALICAFMLLLWWGWGRYRQPDANLAESMVVAKNFVVPLNLTLITRGIDFAFAMFYVRLLGPVGTGQFAFVVALYGVFELISRFGLDTLLTREVARNRELSNRYLTNVCALRTFIWVLTTLAMFAVTFIFWQVDRITATEVTTIVIFALAMLFAGYSDALSAAFHAYEKMEYPASLTTISALLRAGLGALVLLLGWGLPAIAWVAVFTVIVQCVWFYVTLRRSLFSWKWEWDFPLQRWMFMNGFPFMVNSLLSNILLNIDIWLLRLLSGEVASGLYSVALKYRFGITILPSMFNFAVFPLFSRYARQTGDGLMGAYRLSVRLLTVLSVPIAFCATILAQPLVLLVGGAEFVGIEESFTLLNRTFAYTGGSDLALKVVIWTIVFNFINSVTQYVLIALDQQRYLTKAFALVVLFNIGGNVLFIPLFGYVGAALVTILSELCLFIPFHIGIRRHLGPMPWLTLLWKPALGLLVMALLHVGLSQLGISAWLAGPAALLGYVGTLLVTGELTSLLAYMPLKTLKTMIRPGDTVPE